MLGCFLQSRFANKKFQSCLGTPEGAARYSAKKNWLQHRTFMADTIVSVIIWSGFVGGAGCMSECESVLCRDQCTS